MASNSFRAAPPCLAVVTPIDPATCLPDTAGNTSFVLPFCSDWEITDELSDDIDLSATDSAGAPCGPQMRIIGRTKYKQLTCRLATTDWLLEAALMGGDVAVDLNGTGDAVGIQRLTSASSSFCSPSQRGAVSIAIVRGAGICGTSGFCAPPSLTGATNCVLEVFPYVTNIRRSPGTLTKTDANEPEYIAEVYPLGFSVPGPFMGYPNTVQANAIHLEHFVDCDTLPSPSCDPVPYPFL